MWLALSFDLIFNSCRITDSLVHGETAYTSHEGVSMTFVSGPRNKWKFPASARRFWNRRSNREGRISLPPPIGSRSFRLKPRTEAAQEAVEVALESG